MEQTKTINRLTFLQFTNELKGKYIVDKNGFEVPKFLVYWSGLSYSQIKERFNLIDRK
jgi:hypothetical protein